MEETIYNELEDAIFNIVVKHQDELGITSGDEYVDFTLTIKLLAEQILHTLIYQGYTNNVECSIGDYGTLIDSLGRDLRIENTIREIVKE